MSLQHCEWCYNSPFLRETYDGFVDNFNFYLGDSDDFPRLSDPKKIVAGMLLHDFNEIRLRRDLLGKYSYVPVSRFFNIDNRKFLFRGYVPVPLDEVTAAHELEHALTPREKSEAKIDRRAWKKYIDFYVKNKVESYLKDAEKKTREYIV